MPRRAAAAVVAEAPAVSTKKKEGNTATTGAAAEAPPTGPVASVSDTTTKKSGVEEEVEDIFEEDETILAKDSGQLYEAKVLKVQERKKGNAPQYFIHYLGWKSKWDKWVGSDALLKKNEINIKLQAQLKQAAKKRPGAGGSGGEEGEEGGKSEDHSKRGKKERGGVGEGPTMPIDPDVEPMTERANDPQVKLAMPFTLKKQLVDDWEMVTREPRQLVPLPRTPSAADVLASFLAQKKEKGSTSALQLRRFEELLDGLRVYFDRALPLILLYRHERSQYDQFFSSSSSTSLPPPALSAAASSTSSLPTTINSNASSSISSSSSSSNSSKRPSDIYGAEHLLRLFVRLPHLLALAPMAPAELTQVQARLGEILKFLQKQHGDVFLTNYGRKEEEEGEGGKDGGKAAVKE